MGAEPLLPFLVVIRIGSHDHWHWLPPHSEAVTPGIPDKKLVFLLTQSYYKQLVEAGIHIYEYTPGFIHAKCFASDDKVATVGTINMDYRSLYLHFENGVFMYKNDAVMQLKHDMEKTFEISQRITKEMCQGNLRKTLTQSVLRLLAPLL